MEIIHKEEKHYSNREDREIQLSGEGSSGITVNCKDSVDRIIKVPLLICCRLASLNSRAKLHPFVPD